MPPGGVPMYGSMASGASGGGMGGFAAGSPLSALMGPQFLIPAGLMTLGGLAGMSKNRKAQSIQGITNPLAMLSALAMMGL